MERASYASAATNAASARGPAAMLRRAVQRTGAEMRARRAHRSAAVGAEIRRRDALVAPERLGELGGLAIAHAVRHLAHGQRTRGQHLGGLLHADPRQVIAERRLADLGVCPLQLPPR